MINTNFKMALTPEMVAFETGLHVNTVYHLLKTNQIRHVKLSRVYLISWVEFEKWLAGQSNGPPANGVAGA